MSNFIKQISGNSPFEKTFYLLGFLVAATLPIYTAASSILLFAFIGIIWISRGKYLFKKQHTYSTVFLSTTILLFLIPIIAFLFSDSIYDSTKAVGKYLLYLLMPITLLCLSDKERKTFLRSIKKGLIVGALIASTIMLVNLSIRVFKNPEPFQIKTILNYYHTYYNFTSILSKHPTYIGAEIFLAIVFLYSYLPSANKNMYRILGYTSLFLMTLCLVFINSRVILILFAFLILIMLLRYVVQLSRSKQFLRIGIFLFSFIVAGLLVYKAISKTYFFHRITHELSWELSNEVGTKVNSTFSSDSRVARWNSALKLIQEKWVLGYGNNSEKRELYKQYEKDGLIYAMQSRYDAHNVYLAYLIEYGIWGVTVLLIFILQNITQAFRLRDLNSFFLILMIAIIGLSENYLKTSEGILLTTLFVNSLALQKNRYFSKATL